MKIIDIQEIDNLISLLREMNYLVVGPTIQNGAIIYSQITTSKDLPIGYTDDQSPGRYRLIKDKKESYFNYVVGPQSWKKFLYPAIQKLYTAYFKNNKLEIEREENPTTKYAFIGVRSCEINAIEIQDRIFFGGEYQNSRYKGLRKNCFIVAVNCSKANSNCFCTSMNTGPEVKSGFDLVLTEVINNSHHFFLIDSGSEKGEEVLSKLNTREPDKESLELGNKVIEETKKQITKQLETEDLKDILLRSLESPVYDEVSKRCLACGNCTMVCPTCFCMTVEDYTDFFKTKAERIQKWDSCFTLEYSYIHGGSVRVTTGSRYRQWLTHKLASWHEQFGTSGCVGCGRCITWCPVGIDITEEATKVRRIAEFQTTSMEEI
ncbi:MAG: 4Fe-4S dicluster domain-containing protein [Ignavibacteria bacterium]|nr:4Fe-4S dicluster domain-containing protein [Ignavibacteria bacterium]